MGGPRSYKPQTGVRFPQLGLCSRKHLERLPGCRPGEAGSIPVDCAPLGGSGTADPRRDAALDAAEREGLRWKRSGEAAPRSARAPPIRECQTENQGGKALQRGSHSFIVPAGVAQRKRRRVQTALSESSNPSPGTKETTCRKEDDM